MDERRERNQGADRVTRRRMMMGVGVALGSVAMTTGGVWAAEDGISRIAESIHQEPVFKARKKRVYEVLTNAKEFDKVVRLSGAMDSIKSLLEKNPTEVSGEAGAAFSLFGGYVTGRNIQMLPEERIVQAWRSGSWAPGQYSIARFELKEDGAATKIIFDHRGFPDGTAQHLAEGWRENYWEPLAKYLG